MWCASAELLRPSNVDFTIVLIRRPVTRKGIINFAIISDTHVSQSLLTVYFLETVSIWFNYYPSPFNNAHTCVSVLVSTVCTYYTKKHTVVLQVHIRGDQPLPCKKYDVLRISFADSAWCLQYLLHVYRHLYVVIYGQLWHSLFIFSPPKEQFPI